MDLRRRGSAARLLALHKIEAKDERCRQRGLPSELKEHENLLPVDFSSFLRFKEEPGASRSKPFELQNHSCTRAWTSERASEKIYDVMY